jgi:hypothetical protein
LWKTIEADSYVNDERLIIFMKDEKAVLTAVLANVAYWQPETNAPPVPLMAQCGGFTAKV